jgi:hypothetical protein
LYGSLEHLNLLESIGCILDSYIKERTSYGMMIFNDSHKHKNVVHMLDSFIDDLKRYANGEKVLGIFIQ